MESIDDKTEKNKEGRTAETSVEDEKYQETPNECPEINYGKYLYEQSQVDQSFMNTSSF